MSYQPYNPYDDESEHDSEHDLDQEDDFEDDPNEELDDAELFLQNFEQIVRSAIQTGETNVLRAVVTAMPGFTQNPRCVEILNNAVMNVVPTTPQGEAAMAFVLDLMTSGPDVTAPTTGASVAGTVAAPTTDVPVPVAPLPAPVAPGHVPPVPTVIPPPVVPLPAHVAPAEGVTYAMVYDAIQTKTIDVVRRYYEQNPAVFTAQLANIALERGDEAIIDFVLTHVAL